MSTIIVLAATLADARNQPHQVDLDLGPDDVLVTITPRNLPSARGRIADHYGEHVTFDSLPPATRLRMLETIAPCLMLTCNACAAQLADECEGLREEIEA